MTNKLQNRKIARQISRPDISICDDRRAYALRRVTLYISKRLHYACRPVATLSYLAPFHCSFRPNPPALRNGTPSLLFLVLLLVCASFFSCSSSFNLLISFYILHFDFSVLLPSSLSSFLFNLDFHPLSLLYIFSLFSPSLFPDFFLSSLTFLFIRSYSLDQKYYNIVISIS